MLKFIRFFDMDLWYLKNSFIRLKIVRRGRKKNLSKVLVVLVLRFNFLLVV